MREVEHASEKTHSSRARGASTYLLARTVRRSEFSLPVVLGVNRKEARWTVSDVVAYPKVPKGHDLVWATCRNDRVEDTSIVAVVRNSKQPWLQAVGWAYRADEASGKFTKVDPKRVDCVNTALDAD
jgi:hypothetical protein